MKKTLIALTLALLPCVLHATPADSAASAADRMYRDGLYTEAASLYEEVIADGYASADLYYNLGNAYYRSDRIGLAILNYERALRIKPGMGDARDNLALAESRTVDRIAPMPKLFVVRWVDALCSHVAPSAWRIVWLAVLALVCLSFVAMRLGGRRSLRKAGLITGIAALLLLAVATWLLLLSTHRYNSHSEAVVTQQSVTVKNSPEAQSADKFVLHEGSRLMVSDSLAGWYKIAIADGTTGWCLATDIERI